MSEQPYSNDNNTDTEQDNGEDQDDQDDGEQDGEPMVIREQDRFLPIANIMRIMRKVLPKNSKISKDAKECVQECVSEFISFITSEASEKCKREKRKTINGDDILFAMASLGFDNYVEPMRIYLTKYRDHQLAKRGPKREGEPADSTPVGSTSNGNGQHTQTTTATTAQTQVLYPQLGVPGTVQYYYSAGTSLPGQLIQGIQLIPPGLTPQNVALQQALMAQQPQMALQPNPAYVFPMQTFSPTPADQMQNEEHT